VRAAWLEVLERDQIGVEDNFFLLGGNSLHAVRIVARLSDDLDVDLSVRAVLEHPSIQAMSAHVVTAVSDDEDGRC
jgi:iturin family lipopeptide synthetase A